MKIYVASKFENKIPARGLMRLLEGDGHSITFDWTHHDERDRIRKGATRSEYLRDAAESDLMGVLASEALVCLARPNMKGAYVEQGIAIAMGIPVIIVGPRNGPAGWHIFEHLPQDVYRVDTIKEARAALKAIELSRVVEEVD